MKLRQTLQPKVNLRQRFRQTLVLVVGGLLLLALAILSLLKQDDMKANDPPVQLPVPVQPKPPQK